MKNRNNKAFTLIEILAVIVILAIISFIAVPMILKVVDDARRGATEDSAYGLLKATENYIASTMVSNGGVFPKDRIEFDCSKDGCELSTDLENSSRFKKIDVKGQKPISGEIIINNSQVEQMTLDYGNFLCFYPFEENKVKCNDASGDIIQINNITLESTQDSISVTVESFGNIEKYQYSLDGINYFESDNNTYIFNNLNRDTLYTVYVKISSEEKTVENSKTIKTLLFPEIIFQLENENVWTKSKTLTINYPEGAFIKKYKILSGKVEGLELNQEYVVTDNVVALKFTSPGDIEITISDEEKSQTEIYTVSNVDSEIPSLEVIVNDLNVTINSSDNEGSGIDSYCITSSNTVESCEFIKTDDNIINIQMETYGKYYAYVKDKAENISSSFEFELSFDGSTRKIAGYDYKSVNGNTLLDTSGNGKDVTLNKVNVTNDGLLFDGRYANDYISFYEFNSQNFSVDVVFKLADFKNETQTIIGNFQNGGVGIYVDSHGYLTSEAYIDGEYRRIKIDSLVELNKIYAVMMTFNNNTFSMYVNGELIGSYSSDKPLSYPEDNTIFMVGQNPKGTIANGNHFIGSIYYIDFYDEELLINEIQDIHDNRLQELNDHNYKNIDVGLIAKYDSTINNKTLMDLSGNNSNGTLNDVSIRNNSLVFDGDGVNDYITLYKKNMDDFSITTTFSVQRLKDSQIINNTEVGGCEISVTSDHKLAGMCYINGQYRKIITDYTIEPNKVYTATLNMNNKTLSFYVNKQLIGTYSSSYSLTQPEENTKWMIGQDVNTTGAAGTGKFDGNVYSVIMYGRSLDETEILSIQVDNINKYLQYTEYSIDTNLLASYDAASSLNSTTSLKNLTGNSYNGTISGAKFSDNKLYFDGSNDYVKLRAYNLSNITLAVSFDVPALTSKIMNVISNYEDGGCRIAVSAKNNAVGSCYIDGAYRNISSIDTIVAGNKYDGVLTYDGTKLAFYLNGELQGTYESTKGITAPDDSTIYMIGVNPAGSSPVSDYFKGNIHKLKIYSRAITADEILNLDL